MLLYPVAKKKILAEYGSPDNWLNAVITKKEYLEKENRLNDLVLNSSIVSYHITLKHQNQHALLLLSK